METEDKVKDTETTIVDNEQGKQKEEEKEQEQILSAEDAFARAGKLLEESDDKLGFDFNKDAEHEFDFRSTKTEDAKPEQPAEKKAQEPEEKKVDTADTKQTTTDKEAEARKEIEERLKQEYEQQVLAAQQEAYNARVLAEQYAAAFQTQSAAAAPSAQTADTTPSEDDFKKSLKDKYADLLEDYPELMDFISDVTTNKVQSVQKNFSDMVEQRINPIQNYVQQSSQTTQQQQVAAAHPDYAEIVSSGKLLAWANNLPAYAQRAFQQVAADGTAEEIISLLDQYKADTGTKKTGTQKQTQQNPTNTQVGTSAMPNQSQNTVDIDEITQRVAAALAVKPTYRPEAAGMGNTLTNSSMSNIDMNNLTGEQAFKLAGQLLKDSEK